MVSALPHGTLSLGPGGSSMHTPQRQRNPGPQPRAGEHAPPNVERQVPSWQRPEQQISSDVHFSLPALHFWQVGPRPSPMSTHRSDSYPVPHVHSFADVQRAPQVLLGRPTLGQQSPAAALDPRHCCSDEQHGLSSLQAPFSSRWQTLHDHSFMQPSPAFSQH